MADTRIYDSNQISIMIGPVPIAGGYADGEFCKIHKNTDDFIMVVGTDGSVTRSNTNDDSHEVTITLMQSASANNALSALRNLDKITPNGAGVGPLLIRDRQGTTVFAAAHCWIAGPPDAVFDRGATGRAWKIHTSDMLRNDGGN